MKRRFIVALDAPTKQQQDIVSLHFQNSDCGFWHWFRDLWLITDPHLKWTNTAIRDTLRSLVPGVRNIVIDVQERGTWAGFGRTEEFQWLHDAWDPD